MSVFSRLSSLLPSFSRPFPSSTVPSSLLNPLLSLPASDLDPLPHILPPLEPLEPSQTNQTTVCPEPEKRTVRRVRPLMEERVWPTPAYVRSLPRLMEWRPSPKFLAKQITAEVRRILAVPAKPDFTLQTLSKSTPASTVPVDTPAAHDCAPQESPLTHPVVTEPTPAALELDPPTPDEASPAPSEAPPVSSEAPPTPIEAPPTPVVTPPAPDVDAPPAPDVDAAPAPVEGPPVLITPDDIFAHEPKVTVPVPRVTAPPVPLSRTIFTPPSTTSLEPPPVPPVSVPSPSPYYISRVPEFNKNADLHLWRFHFEILCGDLFDEEVEAWVPTVSPMIGQPVIVGLVEDRPVVWHSCAEWQCDLCSLTFEDETELRQHTTKNRHRNELSRQWKWRHLCGLCGVTTTGIKDFRRHCCSKKHRRCIKRHYYRRAAERLESCS